MPDVDRDAAARSGRVDHALDCIVQLSDVLSAQPPIGQAFCPGCGGFLGSLRAAFIFAPQVGGVDPGFEIGRFQFRKGQYQVGQVSLGVDQDGRDALQGGFLQ